MKIINSIIVAALLVQTFIFPLAMPNLILCFGEDGHVAFEWQNETDHCIRENSVSNIAFRQVNLQNHGIHETGCADIDLHFHPASANKTQRHNFTDDGGFISGYSCTFTADHIRINHSKNFNYSPAKDQILAAVQATVLLI